MTHLLSKNTFSFVARNMLMTLKALRDISERDTILPCGTRVITRDIPNESTTDIYFLVNAGARDQIFGSFPHGTAHFLEHIAAKRVVKYKKGDSSDILLKQGGILDAMTSSEFTVYNAQKIQPQFVSLAISELSGIVCRPKFIASEIDFERGIILAEASKKQFDEDGQLFEGALKTGYEGYSPLDSVIGTKKTISEIKQEDIYGFYNRNYTAERTVIIIEGNVNHDNVVAQLNNEFYLPRGEGKREYPLPEYIGGCVTKHEPVEDTRVCIGFNCKGQADNKELVTYNALANVLGGFAKPVLLKALRIDRGLVYEINIRNDWNNDFLTISFKVPASHVTPCLHTIADELKEIVASPPHEQLSEMRHYSEISFKKEMGQPKFGMNKILMNIIREEKLLPKEYFFQKIQTVSAEDISIAAKNMLSRPPTFAASGNVSQVPNYEKICEMFFVKEPHKPNLVGYSGAWYPSISRYDLPQFP